MEPAFADLIKQGNDALSKLPLLRDRMARMREETGNDWFSDLLHHLTSEILIAYSMMVADYSARNNQFSMSYPSLFAWRARNLLELGVWLLYCMGDKQGARRFYDDKGRDFMDLIKGLETLVKSISNPIRSEESRAALKQAQDKLRHRGGLENADYEEPFLRVIKAVYALNQENGDAFISLNKFLSKFAHPTALTVFSTFDSETSGNLVEAFFAVGASIFSMAVVRLEEFTELPQ